MLGLAMLAFAASWGERARAEGGLERVSLRWNAPEACPDDVSLTQAVEAYLGQPLSVTREQPLSILVDVTANAAGFAAKLRFKSPSGIEERELEHPECQKLTDAAALVIALVIDPARVNARQAAPAAAVAAALPLAAKLGPVVVSAAPPAAARDATPVQHPEAVSAPFQFPLEVSGLIGGGALPGVGPGLGLSLFIARGHFEAGLVGRYWVPREKQVPGSPSADISLGWLAAELRGCGLPWLGAWRLRLCVGGGGGDLWGHGQGVSNSRTRHTALPTLSVGTSLAYGGDRLSPFIGLDASLLLLRPRLGVSQAGESVEVFKSSTAAVSGQLGLIYRL